MTIRECFISDYFNWIEESAEWKDFDCEVLGWKMYQYTILLNETPSADL